MTTATFSAAATESTSTRVRRPILRTTIISGLTSAAAVTLVVVATRAAGVSYEIDGEMIPLAGFAQMTAVGAILGGVLAKLCSRRSSGATARRRFLQITTGLTIASCVPSVALPQDAATKVALVATHVLAAAIIVPALARRTAR